MLLTTSFMKAMEFLQPVEGGFVDNPKDRGGATNHGVSLRLLKSLSKEKLRKYGFYCDEPDVDDVIRMTPEQAHKLFFWEFWIQAPFNAIEDQMVCNYVFSMAVNMGISPAIKDVQRAIWAVSRNCEICKMDGILGKITLELLNKYNRLILPALRSECAGDYRVIVAKDPEQKEFISGWLTRAYES